MRSTVDPDMRRITTYSGLAALGVAAAFALSACGGSSGSSSASASGSQSSAQDTVSTKSVDGVGTVLVDAKGMALYSPVQEANGMVHCTGSCTSIWVPLTLRNGKTQPAASSTLMPKLGVVTRPGGTKQVTFEGRPLYTFAEDTKSGSVSGNGVSDSFGGKSFTWHVASTGKVSANSSSTSTTTSSTSSHGGGYGY